MQSSPVYWEECELAQVLPTIPNVCAFCHEVIGTHLNGQSTRGGSGDLNGTDLAETTAFRRRKYRKLRKPCDHGLAIPSSDILYPGSRKSSTNQQGSISKLAENVQNLASSSSSSSLSLYTSESSGEDSDKDDRLFTDSSTSPACSFVYDQPPDTVGLPSDYLSKYSSLQDWLTKRKTLRNAMGTKGDVTRWLQNKKRRTPLEDRVLAQSKPKANQAQESSIQAVKCGFEKTKLSDSLSHVRSDTRNHEPMVKNIHTLSFARDIGSHVPLSHEILRTSDGFASQQLHKDTLLCTLLAHTKSLTDGAVKQFEDETVSQETSKSTDQLNHNEPLSGEQVSVIDEYLRQRHIRLFDLFRCVDVTRAGSCLRQDFHDVLKQAKVPLTQTEVEQLADSLSIDDHPDCVKYSQLALAMNRDSEMKLFKNKSPADSAAGVQSESTVSVSSFIDSNANQALCTEVAKNQQAVCGDQKGSYCRRVVKLFRDNTLFGKAKTGKKSSNRRNIVVDLKSTLNDDEGTATRMQEMRLRDRIEYEATRDAVRRHRLPVGGRALRRGLLTAADHPYTSIDVRRLPRSQMLDPYDDSSSDEEAPITIDFESDDSLEREIEEDERRCAADEESKSVSASASGSSLRSPLGLRIKSSAVFTGRFNADAATSSRLMHSHSSISSIRSLHDGQFGPGSVLEIGGENLDISDANKRGDKRGKSKDEEQKGEGETEKRRDSYPGGAGDRQSTQATGMPTRPRDRYEGKEWKRWMRDLEEQAARKSAIYWPGRSDHVRIYRTDGERGGHPIFERVRQTWYNDDPRYSRISRPDDDQCCRRAFQQHPSPWIGSLAMVYRCVPINDSADH